MPSEATLAVADEERAAIVRALAADRSLDGPTECTIDGLAEAVADATLPADEASRSAVRSALFRMTGETGHLARLEAAGVVEWRDAGEVVAPGEAFGDAVAALDADRDGHGATPKYADPTTDASAGVAAVFPGPHEQRTADASGDDTGSRWPLPWPPGACCYALAWVAIAAYFGAMLAGASRVGIGALVVAAVLGAVSMALEWSP